MRLRSTFKSRARWQVILGTVIPVAAIILFILIPGCYHRMGGPN
jgi:hypothetical protein